MKVLIVSNRDSYHNPYVPTLADGLIAAGCDVTCSIDEFWSNATSYDLIHIQWPNLLQEKLGTDCANLKAVFAELKKHNIPVVVTLHNLMPHYCKDALLLLAYELVYRNAYCFIHLGNESVDLLKKQMPGLQAKHFVIPHHVYDWRFNMDIDKKEARRKLGVPEKSKCVLCFGSFRDDEERNLVIDLSRRLKGSYYFLMPGFYHKVIIQKNLVKFFSALLKTIKYSVIAWKHNLHISHAYIPDDKVPLYMASADVLVIQRLKILNSGNVPLAMLAGLPIVGPNVGNVGWMLKSTGNGTFDIADTSSLADVVESCLGKKSLGESNRKFALQNLSTEIVAAKTKKLYEDILQESCN